jgi:CheY-like chemotaxis protein
MWTKPTSRMLIADADWDTRALYREEFTRAGCDVVEASDGREALVKAISEPPTLIITEISLPFIDGYALCELLRRDRTTAHVPILVVTTEASPAQIVRAQRAGADVVLIKPTPPEHVLSEARRLLARAKELHGRASATSADVAGQFEASANLTARFKGHSRTTLSKSFPRTATRTPPSSPPALRCPSCDRLLTYQRSELGGVSHRHSEQWDYYRCATCGAFQYRQRTRTLRSIS